MCIRDRAMDIDGSVIVADPFNQNIRRMTTAGVVTTIGGSASTQGSANGWGTAATFNRPDGVAVTSGGIIYVVDRASHRVIKGIPSTTPPATEARLSALTV